MNQRIQNKIAQEAKAQGINKEIQEVIGKMIRLLDVSDEDYLKQKALLFAVACKADTALALEYEKMKNDRSLMAGD